MKFEWIQSNVGLPLKGMTLSTFLNLLRASYLIITPFFLIYYILAGAYIYGDLISLPLAIYANLGLNQ